MDRGTAWRWVGTFAALCGLLASAACGARLSDEELADAVRAGRGQLAAGAVAPSGASGPRTATTAAGSPGPTVAGGPVAADPAAGGGPESAGGPAPEARTAPCSPQPSDEVGVTDTELRLGNVSTISGPIAGFGRTGVNGARAYLEYVNSRGGVCGRRLTLATADDRLDAGQNRAEASRLAREVIGFVGGTTVVDAGLASVLEGTNIANASLAISDAAIRSPNIFAPLPIDPTGATQGTGNMWRYFKATRGITKVAIVYPAQSDARTRAHAYIPDVRAAGLAVDGPYEVAITETNYVGVAQQIENSGADAVLTALEISGMSRLALAFEQIGYRPKVPFYGAQAYGGQFLELAGSAAEGTTLGLAYAIFEDAPANPTVATFLDWYRRVAPDSDPDFFAVMGWTAADMMVQALEAAGAAPTRDAVLAFLRGLHRFDAHGFLAPNDPAGKKAAPDFLVVTVKDGKWVREYPATGGFGT